MHSCLKCGVALASKFVSGGTASHCDHCELNYLSVAHLMKQSDGPMVRDFWEYVLDGQWANGKPCPRCHHPLSRIPLQHGEEQHPILGCKSCYHVILKEVTMARFKKQSHEGQEKTLQMNRPLEGLLSQLSKVGESRLTVQLRQNGGKSHAFGFSLGVMALLFLGLIFLRQTGSAAFWSLLTAGCAFGIGMRSARLVSRRVMAQAKDLYDVGSQSRVPMIRPTGFIDKAPRRVA